MGHRSTGGLAAASLPQRAPHSFHDEADEPAREGGYSAADCRGQHTASLGTSRSPAASNLALALLLVTHLCLPMSVRRASPARSRSYVARLQRAHDELRRPGAQREFRLGEALTGRGRGEMMLR